MCLQYENIGDKSVTTLLLIWPVCTVCRGFSLTFSRNWIICRIGTQSSFPRSRSIPRKLKLMEQSLLLTLIIRAWNIPQNPSQFFPSLSLFFFLLRRGNKHVRFGDFPRREIYAPLTKRERHTHGYSVSIAELNFLFLSSCENCCSTVPNDDQANVVILNRLDLMLWDMIGL